MDWRTAIVTLEQANEAVNACQLDDLGALETALAGRDRAVHAIANLDPRALSPDLAARLQAAFETGVSIRNRLASVYRTADTELHRVNCVRRFFESAPH